MFAPLLFLVWFGLLLYSIFFYAPPVLQLGDSARNILLHLPVAWVSALAYLLSAVFGVIFLVKKQIRWDIYSSHSAGLGFLFSWITVTTGMVWAKYDWGAAWNWDPRETTFLFILIIYGAYFSLRGAVKDSNAKARLSAVYIILAFFTVPFLYFIVPRSSALPSTLHPDIIGQLTQAPSNTEASKIFNTTYLIIFCFSMVGFTSLFLYLWYISIKLSQWKNKIKEINLEDINF